MKKTGTWPVLVHGAAIYAASGFLSRPIIGHTPRKLPPCGAISRFIAVSAGGAGPTTRTCLSYRIFHRMSIPFSPFFIIFLKKFWIREEPHGNGSAYGPGRLISMLSLFPPAGKPQAGNDPGLAKSRDRSVCHHSISAFPCTAGSPPRPGPGSRWDSPSPCAHKTPAPYPRR